ncbi:MAG: DUF58 domain-containing protein [Ardenticatenaceae bacterium]|nr:DUF58 domain-containing protein [Ardenticatenaceae bacterium]
MRDHWRWLIGATIVSGVLLQAPLLLLLGLLLMVIAAIVWVWDRACLAGVSYERRLENSTLFWGEETDLVVTIANLKPLPLPWLRVEDEVPEEVVFLTGRLSASSVPRRATLRNVLALAPYERIARRYRVQASQRGDFRFGPATLVTGDLFGFQRRERQEPRITRLLVYPRLVPLEALGLDARRPFGPARTRRRLIEDPLLVRGVREYTLHDSLRAVHWPATARLGRLQAKQYEPTATRRTLIFLNVASYPHAYEGVDPYLLELAITTAASLARWALDQSEEVGLYANSSVREAPSVLRIPPAAGPAQLQRLLEALARLSFYVLLPLADLIEREARHLPFGATLVVITATVDDTLVAVLSARHRAGMPVLLLTLGRPPDLPPLLEIAHQHIGGRERWEQLESLAIAPGQDGGI